MKKKIFMLYIIVTLVFFGMLFRLGYATDTYQVFNFNENELFTQFASSGRFVTAIIGKIVKATNLSEKAIYIGSYILAIICVSLSQYKLYNFVKKDLKSRALKFVIPILIIINPFSIELFMYIENGIMALGILMCIYATENTIKYFETKQKKYILYSTIFMFVANCCYQGVTGIFIAIILIYILKYSKTIRQFIKNNFIIAVIYGISAIIDYLIVKINFPTNRLSGSINILESFKKISINIVKMAKNMYNLLPKYVFILAILFTFLVFCYKIWKERKNYIHILKFFYIVIGISFAAVVPQVVQPTESIWFVPRSTYCFASLYGILIWNLAMDYELDSKLKNFVLVVSICLIVLQLKSFVKIEQDRYIVNEKDYEISMQIISNIEKYEAETGNRITHIAIYQDSKPKYTYDGILAIGDVNIKAYSTDWSTVGILNYYLKRELKTEEKKENMAKEFLSKNWDEFNEEQIMFENSTLIICRY